MQSKQLPNRPPDRDSSGRAGLRSSRLPMWRSAWLFLVFAAAFSCVAQDGKPAAVPVDKPASPADPSPLGKQNAQGDISAKDAGSHITADSQRRQQLSAASTQLLAMAVDLKAEVDKTSKDTLSMTVIRKADAIERLAKTVKEKIKQNSKPS